MTIISLDALFNLPWLIAKAFLTFIFGSVIIFELINALCNNRLRRPGFISRLERALHDAIAFVGNAFFSRHQ